MKPVLVKDAPVQKFIDYICKHEIQTKSFIDQPKLNKIDCFKFHQSMSDFDN